MRNSGSNVSDAEFQRVLAQCRNMIQVGSKSFSLAARIFGPEKRDAAFLLYGWCRHCDDTVDQVDGASLEKTEHRLAVLREQTQAAYDGKSLSHPVFIAFQHIVHRYEIPSHYPFELLEGMAMDIRGVNYPNLESLLLYCYRVAGTVGLMMSHVMGLSDEHALKNAAALGTAMQLTNISRDVLEDAQMGRVYLPEDWLREEGIVPQKVADLENRKPLARVVGRLLSEAERYYRLGDAGLPYLSFRSACTIAAARGVYSEIGVRVRKLGPHAWDNRVWVPLGRKLWVMSLRLFKVLCSLPQRWRQHWRAKPIRVLWRFEGALAIGLALVGAAWSI